MNCKDASEVKQLAKQSDKAKLENSFHSHWVLMFGDLPEPVRQHPILNPETNRHFKLDFAWVEEKLAVEIQGGAWGKGGHNTALGQAHDYARHNYLTRIGWRILYFNSPMLKDTAGCVELTAEILCGAEEVIPTEE